MATGPLTSPALEQALLALLGEKYLYFYDAMAPIVEAASLDMDRLFALSRYGKGGGDDYLNVPLARAEYEAFVAALLAGEKVPFHDFEKAVYFEGCLPVEAMAERGVETLRHGPMKPFGLPDPRTGREPYAVVQLRQDDLARTHFNLVGFQTKLKVGEQRRIFRTLPGLANAEFVRYGMLHRNTYINGPAHLDRLLPLAEGPARLLRGPAHGRRGLPRVRGHGPHRGRDARAAPGGERARAARVLDGARLPRPARLDAPRGGLHPDERDVRPHRGRGRAAVEGPREAPRRDRAPGPRGGRALEGGGPSRAVRHGPAAAAPPRIGAEESVKKNAAAAVIVVLLAAAPAAVAADARSENFQTYCSVCHGDDGKGQTEEGKKKGARDLTNAKWQDKIDDARMVRSVTKGHDKMPSFEKKLSADEIKALVAEVRTLAKK